MYIFFLLTRIRCQVQTKTCQILLTPVLNILCQKNYNLVDETEIPFHVSRYGDRYAIKRLTILIKKSTPISLKIKIHIIQNEINALQK